MSFWLSLLSGSDISISLGWLKGALHAYQNNYWPLCSPQEGSDPATPGWEIQSGLCRRDRHTNGSIYATETQDKPPASCPAPSCFVPTAPAPCGVHTSLPLNGLFCLAPEKPAHSAQLPKAAVNGEGKKENFVFLRDSEYTVTGAMLLWDGAPESPFAKKAFASGMVCMAEAELCTWFVWPWPKPFHPILSGQEGSDSVDVFCGQQEFF